MTAKEQPPDNLLDHLRALIEGVEDRVVLPSQFFSPHEPEIPPGEKKIRYRILKDAIREYHKTAFSTSKRGIAQHNNVYGWIIRNDYDWPYSFVNLCDVFGIHAEAARAALWQWKTKEQERRYEANAATAQSTGPECCPSLPPEGGTHEA